MKQFNLTGDPWIPVLWRNGRRSEVPLPELFERGGEIADLAVPPAERIVLMRLLLCIVMRSMQEQEKLPEYPADWLELTSDLIAKHAAEYLRKWRDAFDLYGDRAFLQANGLARQNNASQDKLDFTLASGNNHTLFDHAANEDGRTHSDAWLARKLLVSQSFSTGGTIGQNIWNGVPVPNSSGASPLMEGSPLHVFCLGQNILETLHLNLIFLAELNKIKLGVPVWEAPPDGPAKAQEFDTTLFGRLVPISRAVKLTGDSSRVTVAEACRYSKLPNFTDPYLSNKKSKDKKAEEKILYLGIYPDRHPWRELESLLTLAGPGPGSGVTPPKNLLVKKYLPRESILRLWCGGVAAKKANYTFTGEWTLSLPVWKISRSEFILDLFDFTKNAERIEGVIKTHIDLFWDTLSEIRKAGSSKNREIRNESRKSSLTSEQKRELDASRLREYWSRLNRAVPRFLAEENEDVDFVPLYKQLKSIALDSFRENLPSSSPWHLMACGKIMPFFRSELGKIINPYLPKGEI